MKMLTSVFGVLAGLALVGMVTGQNNNAVKEEMKKLEGTWTLQWIESGGTKMSIKDFKEPIEFAGFNASTVIKDGQSLMNFEGKATQYSFTVDPTKTPKTMDRIVAESKFKDGTRRYLYELEGNMLRLCCNAEKGDVRPKEFKSKGTLTILTFERRKP